MERKCAECPAFYKCDKEGLTPTAGGWETKKIDGKEVLCCRPAEKLDAKRYMKRFCLYCLAKPVGKMIGTLASWTGRTPIWCPLGRKLK